MRKFLIITSSPNKLYNPHSLSTLKLVVFGKLFSSSALINELISFKYPSVILLLDFILRPYQR